MFSLPPPLRLRAICAADQAFVDTLYRSCRDDLALVAPTEAFLAQLLRIQQQAQAQGMRGAFPQSEYFVIERDSEAIGRMVVEAAGGRVHLVDLVLLPAARGQGCGSAVLRALQAMAARRAEPLTLSVSMANDAARRLYLRLGFVACGADALQQSLRWEAHGACQMTHFQNAAQSMPIPDSQ